MTKRLYAVEWCGVCAVWAASAAEAERLALDAVRRDADGAGLGADAATVGHIEDLPEEWEDCPPWGSDDDRTCAQILRGDALAEDAAEDASGD